VRDRCEQEALWAEVMDGAVDIVASDHSPAPPELKSGDFLRAWGGIAGVQSTLAVLLSSGHYARGLPLERIGSLLAFEPARRFQIPGKGRLAPGSDADLALVDLSTSFTLQPEHLHQRNRMSPYLGVDFRGAILRTILRGETIFRDGTITARTRGRLIRPQPV
jgi:allantoinase